MHAACALVHFLPYCAVVAGGNINAVTFNGWTSLHHAAVSDALILPIICVPLIHVYTRYPPKTPLQMALDNGDMDRKNIRLLI